MWIIHMEAFRALGVYVLRWLVDRSARGHISVIYRRPMRLFGVN